MGLAALESRVPTADACPMQSWMLLPYLALTLSLVRSLLVAAKIVPPQCRRCGLARERRDMGDTICRCH